MSTQAIAQPKSRRLSPFAALLWEEWRQTRLALLAGTALAALPLLVAAFQHWRNALEPHDAGSALYGILSLLFCWQAAVLLFSGCGRNDMTMQFPRRLFSLPVPSVALALTRLAYGVAVVAVTFVSLGWLLAQSQELSGPSYTFALWAVPSLIYIESIAWSLGRRPLLAVPLGLVLYLPLVYILEVAAKGMPGPPLAAALLALLPALAAFTALALFAVRSQRHGGGGRITAWRPFAKTRSDAAAAPQLPERALFGYEWRRRGRWVLAFGLLSPAAMTVLSFQASVGAAALFFFLLLGCLTGLLAAGMFQFFVSERDRVSGLQRFLATRAASTRKLGHARLWALGAGYSMAFVILCLLLLGTLHVAYPHAGTRTLVLQTFLFPVQAIEERLDELHKQPVPAQEQGDRHVPEAPAPGRATAPDVEVVVKYQSVSWGLIKVFASLVFLYLLGWLCLTQPITTIFIFYLAAVLGEAIDRQAGREPDWGYTLLSAIIAAGILGLTLSHLRRAFRQDLLSRRALYTLLVAWFTLAYAAVYLCVRAGGTPREVLGLQSSIVALALVLAVSALPIWPFATIPLSIHRHRHQ